MRVLEGTPQEIATYQRITGSVQVAQFAGGESDVWSDETVRAFWNSLDRRHNGGRQQKLLRLMVKQEGKATLNEVTQHLKVEPSKLRGVLANITRNARRETGFEKALVVDWANEKGGYYFVPDIVLRLLRDIV
jgi:hypothetical protein